MKKSEIEKTLESVGIHTRDEDGNIRSAEELTKDVMALLEQCDKENGARLLFLLLIARKIDAS